MPIRILSASDVRVALPMSKAIDAMRHAYSQLSAGTVTAPPRQHITTDKGVTLIMPAYLPERSENVKQRQILPKSTSECACGILREAKFGIKVVSDDDNPNLGLPRITATVLVLDPATGTPKAFMDGDQYHSHPNRSRWRCGSRLTRPPGRKNGWTLRSRVSKQGHSCRQ